jgi:beta-N-acetylhexosaminidase
MPVNGYKKLDTSSEWVERTLADMTLDQKIGQLLHPCIQSSAPEEERVEMLAGIEPGGLFLFAGRRDELQEISTWFQGHSAVPLVISADLENGPGKVIEDATSFPALMSLGATDDEELAFEMGRAAALEGRSCGIHWSFGPVVDISANPLNPGTNTRGFGDDPDLIVRLSKATISGMQENGLCATVKHFPGSGFDDRDAHICNTINPLQMDQWFALSGRPFQEAIDWGVWSIMIGHISLPAWDPGDHAHMQFSPPATLSRRIVTDLLRERMGFKGVIITDALDMGGVTSFGPSEEIIPGVIDAGCDMILFSSLKRDFEILKQSIENGRLTEARIEESVRRILSLKETLGLHEDRSVLPLAEEISEQFENTSKLIAEKALTLVVDRKNVLPLKLDKGVRVLSYHIRGDPETNVNTFDDLLREQGVEVTHFNEQDIGKLPKPNELLEYDVVLMSAVFEPSWGTNRIRPAGNYMRDVWSLITSHHSRLVLVSYGSPYLYYEMPHLPLVINAYSPDLNTQRAVMRLLTGEIEAAGTSPVNLDSPYLFKSLEGLRYPLRGSTRDE